MKQNERRDAAVAACILLVTVGVALYALFCLCRISPPVSTFFYLSPNNKLHLVRTLVFPALVCGILCILREAMDGTRRMRPASVAAVTAFSVFPLGALVLFQRTGQYAVSAQQSAAVGICLICFLLCTLMRDLCVRRNRKKAHPSTVGILSLLGVGMWCFLAFLGLTGRFFTLWAVGSSLSVASSLVGWTLFFLCSNAVWIRVGLCACTLSLPIYLAFFQPYDTVGIYSALPCGIFYVVGLVYLAFAAVRQYLMHRKRNR